MLAGKRLHEGDQICPLLGSRMIKLLNLLVPEVVRVAKPVIEVQHFLESL